MSVLRMSPRVHGGVLLEMSRSRIKKFGFVALLVVFQLALLEIFAYVLTVTSVPSRISSRIGKGTPAFHVAQRQKILAARSQAVVAVAAAGGGTLPDDDHFGPIMFHPVLGWDYPANVAYRCPDGMLYSHGAGGERRTCTSFPTTEIVTYGDSFTHCDEVSDESTWQTFLARKIGSNILNYGVGGYGTDQAFLKFRLHGTPKAGVVMLCILPENINRVVNVYRPFYHYDDPLALTKPRFVVDGSGFRFLPNPTIDVGYLAKLEDPQYLKGLGTMDYWYQFDRNMPDIRFPFVLSALAWRKAIVDHASLIASAFSPFVSEPHYPQNLYDNPEAFAIMCHIVDLFVQTAKEKGVTPLIAIMPHKDFVREAMEFRVSRVARFTRYLKEKNYAFVDLVQAMADMRPTGAQLDAWYTGHATAEGNNVTAELMFQYFRQRSLAAVAIQK
jgi:hypothetical protein